MGEYFVWVGSRFGGGFRVRRVLLVLVYFFGLIDGVIEVSRGGSGLGFMGFMVELGF